MGRGKIAGKRTALPERGNAVCPLSGQRLTEVRIPPEAPAAGRRQINSRRLSSTSIKRTVNYVTAQQIIASIGTGELGAENKLIADIERLQKSQPPQI